MKLSVIFEYFDKATALMKCTERQTVSLSNSLKRVQNCIFKINQTAELMGRLGDTIGQFSQSGCNEYAKGTILKANHNWSKLLTKIKTTFGTKTKAE